MEHSPGTALLFATDLQVFPAIANGVASPLVGPVSLAVPPHARIALVGPSGVGKSTLLRGLVRLNAIRAAVYRLHELDALTLAPRELRRQLAYVPQVPMALAGDALANCRQTFLFQGALPLDWQNRATSTLEAVGLDPTHWTTEASELSVGQRMRLSLARALLGNPTILLLDEPLAPLDPAARTQLITFLRAWTATGDRALIACLHDQSDVAALATELWELSGPTNLTRKSVAEGVR